MGTKIIAVIYSTYAVAKRKPEKKKSIMLPVCPPVCLCP